MSSTHRRVVPTRRAARSAVVVALVALASLTGCASVVTAVPQAVVWAPGSHTFFIPIGAPTTWGPTGQVVVCSDTETVLYFQATWGGSMSLTWTPFDGSPNPGFYGLIGDGVGWFNPAPYYGQTSDAVGPGCGTFQYSANAGNPSPYNGPPTATVWVTKTQPTP